MIIIIDGNHLASRCYFSIDELKTSDGINTNCIFGVLSSLRFTIRRFKKEADNFFVAWDSRGKKKRHEIYPEYKAGRKKIPDDFYEQLKVLKESLGYLGVNQFRFKETEADDIIGSLALKARKNGNRVLIISGDHDFEQLVSPHITVLCPKMGMSKEKWKDYDYVVADYGLKPSQIPELMSLTGDPSDNIPGVPKVGEKTAAKLLQANGSLDNIINNVDKLKNIDKDGEVVDASDVIKEKIKENLKVIELAKQLVKIDCDLDFDVNFEKLKPNFVELEKLFKRLEFNRYLEEFDKWKQDLTM